MSAIPRESPELERLQEGRSSSRYTLQGEIARGGMGVVLHVWDTLLCRPLAMKILDLDAAPPEGSEEASGVIARFLEEARVAGQLEHPGVVPVHDLGADESGRAYFTMPLIEGRDGNEVFDLARSGANGWSLTRALLVLVKVCEVVAYAHSRGVVHRDLKPANVMVGKFGETYVMDWGLAKSAGSPERGPAAEAAPAPSASAEHTVDGAVIGTPAYMAPEQAEGRVAEVCFQTDVYALGAMLYRLLAGRSPYSPRHGKDDAAKTIDLVRRGSPTPLGRIAPDAPPELVAVCEKAMARRPEDRYASAEVLADDLQAFLEGRVVRAYEGGFVAEAKKLVRRNRPLVAMIAAIVLTALAAMVSVSWVATRANRDLEAKNLELQIARAEALESARQAILSSYVAQVTGAAASLRAGAMAEARRRLDDCPPELRGWEWAHLRLGTDGSLRVCHLEDENGRPAGGAPACLARGLDANTVFAGYPDGSVREWDVDRGSVHRTFVAAGEGESAAVIALATSPDGRTLATASSNGRLVLHDLTGAESPRVFEGPAGVVSSLAFDPRGTRVASCAQDGGVRLWDLGGSGRELGRVDAPSAVCFAAGGTRLVCAAGDGTLLVFDADGEGEPLRLEGHRAAVHALAAHEGSARIASGSEDGTLRIWDVERAELLEVLSDGERPITAVAVHPSGARVASGDRDGRVRLWDLAEPARPLSFTGHAARIRAIQFDRSGERLVSASWDHTLRVWDVRGPTHASTYRGFDTPFRCAVFAADGARVLLGSSDGYVVLYDSLRGRLERFWISPAAVTAVRFLPGDERVAAASSDGEILVWEAASPSDEPLVLRGHSDAVYALASCGERLLSGSGDGTVRAWDVASGRCLETWSKHSGPVLALDVAADAESFVSASADRSVLAWRATGEVAAALATGDAAVRALALHPGGELLAWADDAGRLALVSLESGETRWSELCEEPLVSLAWSPAGDRLACGSGSGEIQLRDPADGERLFSAREHPGEVYTVAFDARGERLLSVSAEGGLRVLESTDAVANSRSRMDTGVPAARASALVERLFAEALDPTEILQRASHESELTAEERELAVGLARSNVYLAQRTARTSWTMLADADAPAAQRQSALERLREASKLVPGDPALQARLGAALVRAGEPAAGAEVLERALGELGERDRVWAQAFLGLACCALGQTSNAAEMCHALHEGAASSLGTGALELLEELERCLGKTP